MLRCGDDAGARQRARGACNDPALAESACSQPYRFYHGRGDLRAAVAWASELAVLPKLRADLRKNALQWFIEDSIALRRDDDALAMLGRSAETIGPGDSLSLASQTVDAFIAAGRLTPPN